ncbi:MAG TPA: ATP-binding protein [Verrucomicrobiae bacterium]|mgnify:CR=1 FL=1|nr:ATP-binding protein [Verrucomicrobiae bacterium]
MKFTLQRRSFAALAALLAALIVGISLTLNVVLPPYLRQRIETDLTRQAVLVRAALAAVPSEQLNGVVHRLREETGLRVTVIAADGTVVAESNKRPDELAHIENHLFRPEVQEALRLGVGRAQRLSDTVGVRLAYVAVRAPMGFVRVAEPLDEIAATTWRVRHTVAIACLVAGLAAIPVSYWLTRRVTEPISRMRDVAGDFARGDFSRRAPRGLTGELGELATALDNMATQLEGRLRELGEEKAGLAAVLASMSEGVLVVDSGGKIRLMNNAMREQFHLNEDAVGKTPFEALRHFEWEKLMADPGSGEMTFGAPVNRTFLVNAAALCDYGGTVVVLHDITRLKQLENLRKEFVANVSHELRTPLSVIRGYIETLLDEPPPEPDIARRFQQTIQKNVRQLEALIEDLLSISALESQQARLESGLVRLDDVAETVVEELGREARAKAMTVTLEMPTELPAARGDRRRLHQVLINLLANAIKYTQAGGHVILSARADGNEIECCVADDGPGIGAEDLERIFERFYRVGKARSRELGGTGLGLSIVKHIVQAHGGRVWAESVVGAGSRFYFTLPTAV